MNGARPSSPWRELGLSPRARVFSAGVDRVVVDPEAYQRKARVRLDRQVSGGKRRTVLVDELRDLELAAVMVGVPLKFLNVVSLAVKQITAGG